MTKQVNTTAAAAAQTPVMDSAVYEDGTLTFTPAESPVESMLDYSPEVLESIGHSLAESGVLAQYRVYEDNHSITWLMNLPESPAFIGGIHQYITGLNARVAVINAEIASGERKGKARAFLPVNPREYELYRVVTRMSDDRVTFDGFNAGDSGAFRLATFAKHTESGQFFRLPAKLMQVEEFTLFARYAETLNAKRGLVYALSMVQGELWDAMQPGTGKGYTVEFRQNARVALEKAWRISHGFTLYGRNPVSTWNRNARNAGTGESGKQVAG